MTHIDENALVGFAVAILAVFQGCVEVLLSLVVFSELVVDDTLFVVNKAIFVIDVLS